MKNVGRGPGACLRRVIERGPICLEGRKKTLVATVIFLSAGHGAETCTLFKHVINVMQYIFN